MALVFTHTQYIYLTLSRIHQRTYFNENECEKATSKRLVVSRFLRPFITGTGWDWDAASSAVVQLQTAPNMSNK